ncbi:hypothetical protein SAMD00019534_002360 [Acytostelium subglobosum LB1]|uniref:hypothetical protein n=1 Tax=Acytostelium subglobosum LB1 TaxID=1410327 RepID=UPI000644A9DF|nr:hypothetical protein SAMD00019534_002360 [Acytostelium subglobosum LB1]GAM17061.1 hypothetical protein SAMD00019534_002360 [Acytostelium subglobosum LB1]|eukprot:XP_012759123.1 hypothetical protein SAMD00019534_002360 [Acytostelium subglobosum LB1]
MDQQQIVVLPYQLIKQIVRLLLNVELHNERRLGHSLDYYNNKVMLTLALVSRTFHDVVATTHVAMTTRDNTCSHAAEIWDADLLASLSRLNIKVTGCTSADDFLQLARRGAPLERVGTMDFKDDRDGQMVRCMKRLAQVKDTLSSISLCMPMEQPRKRSQWPMSLIVLPSLCNLTHVSILNHYDNQYEVVWKFYVGLYLFLPLLPLLQHLEVGPHSSNRNTNYNFTPLLLQYLKQQRSLTSLRVTQCFDQRGRPQFLEYVLQSPQCTIMHLDLMIGLPLIPITIHLSSFKIYIDSYLDYTLCKETALSFDNVDHLVWDRNFSLSSMDDNNGDCWLNFIIANCPSIRQLTFTMTRRTLPPSLVASVASTTRRCDTST